jgi:hypothetical protein
MMKFKHTFFPYLNKFCIDKFGADIGTKIFTYAEIKLNELINEADYKNNKYIKWHMIKNMLPVIAIYLTFKKFECKAEKSMEYTDEIMQIYRMKMMKRNQLIGNLPFGYYGFKMFCRRIVSKQYPEKGWNIDWISNDANEVHFNMKSCIYVETTNKYSCPELCHLFCANDDVVFSGFRPAIIFERAETIARGQEKCDFHFRSSKYIK